MTTRIQKVAAIVAVGGSFVQIIFQFCLSIGAPWGKAAWGGQQAMEDGSLSTTFQIASGVGVLLWTFILSVVVQRISRKFDGSVMEQSDGSGTLRIRWCQCYSPKFVTCTMWVLTVLMFLATVENFMSRSPVERWTWGPFCTVVFLSFLILARPEDPNDSPEETQLLPSETGTPTTAKEYV
mmetsp:Transcript_48310/g.117023  ORF Transcript_48310/g.117023 Transcript_48310/m.117023 type:complete len:181 (+) Transcript_48310:104-646(+)